jgi:hypothetical protein
MGNKKEVLVRDMVIGVKTTKESRQDNKRKEQRDAETSAKEEKKTTSVSREDPQKTKKRKSHERSSNKTSTRDFCSIGQCSRGWSIFRA